MISRRDLLKLGAGALILPGCGKKFVAVCDAGAGQDPLDVVLAALHETDPEFSGGLSNHGPMAAEVLQHQGRTDRICDWVGGYIGVLARRSPAAPLALDARAAALGDPARRAAWIETYVAEIATGDLQAVLSAAWPTLLPGYAAAAFHGPLRTGHALRALAHLDTPTRRREIAHGLGYWAARHLPLPGIAGANPVAGLDVVQALSQLTILPPGNQQSGGYIHDRMKKIVGFQPFIDDIARVDLDVWPVDRTLTELAAASARLFVADGNRGDLGYLHAVDGTSILRMMLPWMDADTQRTALGYLYQSVAALHATHAGAPGVPQDRYAPAASQAAIAERGGNATDEHTLKLVEAVLREHALDARPEFLVAAERRLG